jgi:hypothetical protein
MRETIEARLAALRREYAAGETQLRRQEQQLSSLRESSFVSAVPFWYWRSYSPLRVTNTPPSREFRPTDRLAVVGGQADGSKG